MYHNVGMISFFIKTSIKLLILSALVYGLFFIPFDNRTIYEHAKRIAATKEGKELTSSVEGSVIRVKEKIKNTVDSIVIGNKEAHKKK